MIAAIFATPQTVAQPQRGPVIDLIRQKVTRSPAAQLIEMTVGPPTGSDWWNGLIRPTDSETMQAAGKTVSSRGGFHYCQVGMNFRVAPLSDVNYRNALSYLVPKDRIIGSLFRYLVVKVNTPVPPAQSLWYNAQVDPHAYSPATAEAILGQTAGAYENVGGVWKYDAEHGGGDLETLRFYVPLEVTAPTSFTIGRMIVEEANAIGLTNINLMPMDFATYLDLVYNQWDYEMFWVCYGLGRNPTHLWDLFNSENNFPGSSNPYGINYPDLDAATDILWTSLDHDAKIAAAQQAQELLMGGSTTDPMPLYVPPTDPRSQALPVFAVYSRNYYDVAQPEIAGTVNMFGYGIDNGWTYLNIHWATANGYRPGTTEKTIVRVEDEFPERLNPLFATTVYANDFMANVVDGLIAVNPYTHKDESWLAESWSYVTTAEGMDVTFNLRLTDFQGQPVKWQDGDPVSASDVQFAWDFLAEEEIPNFWSVMKYYAGSTVIDADTIVASMTAPSQWYVYTLAGAAYLLPPQVWSQAARGWPMDATRLATILGWDASANAYPDPDGAGPLTAVPTCLFGTGPFINMHSTQTIGTQAYGDLAANRNYWLTTAEAQGFLAGMFHSAGDVTYDGEVDTEDLSAIGLAFNTVPDDPLWDPNADVCGPAGAAPDSQVNIFDAATAGKFFGELKESA
jgi:ABC-type transport system substrate-binding protein